MTEALDEDYPLKDPWMELTSNLLSWLSLSVFALLYVVFPSLGVNYIWGGGPPFGKYYVMA